MITHIKYIKKKTNYKYCISSHSTICGEKISVFTNNKYKLKQCELKLSKKVYEHINNCEYCKNTLENREKKILENSMLKVESKMRCGKIIYNTIKYPDKKDLDKMRRRLENDVINSVIFHFGICNICNRIIKINKLNNL